LPQERQRELNYCALAASFLSDQKTGTKGRRCNQSSKLFRPYECLAQYVLLTFRCAGGEELEERIERLLPKLDEMIGGGLITMEKVRVILYRASK